MSDDHATQDPQYAESAWYHMDYYVRRFEGELVLVQTLLRVDPDGAEEICTFYIDLDQLDEEWTEAILTQGEALEEGKSADFVPPDELSIYDDDPDEDALEADDPA